MTPDEIAAQRARVVAEAKTWLGTPWHHEGRVKGAGVDCGQLIIECFANCGLIERPPFEHYPADWAMHRSEERYLGYVLNCADEVAPPPERTPLPGDVVVWRFGWTYSHGGIVADAWPWVIHTYVSRRTNLDDLRMVPNLLTIGENRPDHGKPRPMRVFVLRGWL